MISKPHIQVVCDQSDWSNSSIQVVNVPGPNFATDQLTLKACYTQLKGKDLPDNLKPIFETVIQSFQTAGNQEWFASIVFCYRVHKKTHIEEDVVYKTDKEGNIVKDTAGNPIELSRTKTEVVDREDGVKFSTSIDFPNGTSTTIEQVLEDPAIILLFDTLCTLSFWQSRTA